MAETFNETAGPGFLVLALGSILPVIAIASAPSAYADGYGCVTQCGGNGHNQAWGYVYTFYGNPTNCEWFQTSIDRVGQGYRLDISMTGAVAAGPNCSNTNCQMSGYGDRTTAAPSPNGCSWMSTCRDLTTSCATTGRG